MQKSACIAGISTKVSGYFFMFTWVVCVIICGHCDCVVYVCISQDYTDSPPDSKQVVVVMDSFKSKIIRLRVRHHHHQRCCCLLLYFILLT